MQVNKSIMEEILIQYQNIVILLNEIINIKNKEKEIYSTLFIFDKKLLFWFSNIL